MGGNWVAAAGKTGGRVNRFNQTKQAKDYDKRGEYTRRWIPELANVPAPLIHEPWKMSKAQQVQYGCILGEDYPLPPKGGAPVWEQSSRGPQPNIRMKGRPGVQKRYFSGRTGTRGSRKRMSKGERDLMMMG